MAIVLELYARVSQKALCSRLGLHRSVVNRAAKSLPGRENRLASREPEQSDPEAVKPRHPHNKLSEAEVEKVRKVCAAEEFQDLAVRQIYAILLGRGQYLCSIRTFYRILEASAQNVRRGKSRRHPSYQKPKLIATRPLQVLCYDITRVPGPRRGQWYYWYVVIDLYSRCIVGHSVQESETGHRVRRLLVETFRNLKIKRGDASGVTVHSDRGAQMKSRPVMGFLADMGITASFSRPRVSNDNPFIESFFKTGKYYHKFPGNFASIDEARKYLGGWIDCYNKEHHHSGIALFTPEQVFSGRWRQLVPVHQAALDAAYAEHPERFPKGRPIAKIPPAVVELNPEGRSAIKVVA